MLQIHTNHLPPHTHMHSPTPIDEYKCLDNHRKSSTPTNSLVTHLQLKTMYQPTQCNTQQKIYNFLKATTWEDLLGHQDGVGSRSVFIGPHWGDNISIYIGGPPVTPPDLYSWHRSKQLQPVMNLICVAMATAIAAILDMTQNIAYTV